MKKKKILNYMCVMVVLSLAFMNNVMAASFLDYDSSVSCGTISNIPAKIPDVISSLIKVVQVVVPVLLVIFGIIDLIKGIMAQKEDEVKKGQQTLIKRIIAGACVFFIIMLVKFFVNVVADNNSGNIISCINCFISGECVSNTSSGGGTNVTPEVGGNSVNSNFTNQAY